MTTENIILIGGGGHALVVSEAAALAGFTLTGFVDDDPEALIGRLGVCRRLGALADLAGYSGARVLCVGDVRTRQRLAARLDLSNAASVIHPRAFVSPTAVVGRGVFVGPLAVVHTRARIGDHAVINSGAIIEHECVIGANSHIAPGADLGGNVGVGTGTLVGLGARILPGVSVGSGCTIGAGAVVVDDVPDDATVKGVPAA